MQWQFDAQTPIYAQLVEQFTCRVLSGEYPPGSRAPAVRELAQEAQVNPNTMQRAFTELERQGLVFTQRTSGRFITEDTALLGQLRQQKAAEALREFLEKMRQLGMQREEILALLQQQKGEEHHGDDSAM